MISSASPPLGMAELSLRRLLVEGDAVCIRPTVRELCHGWGPVDRSMVGRLKFVPDLTGDSDEVDVTVDFPPAPGFTVRLSELRLAPEPAVRAGPSEPVFVWERADGDELCHVPGYDPDVQRDVGWRPGDGDPLRQVRGGMQRAAAKWVGASGVVAVESLAELQDWARRLSVPETPAERAAAAAPLQLLSGALVAWPGRCGAVRLRGCDVGPEALLCLAPGLLAQALPPPLIPIPD